MFTALEVSQKKTVVGYKQDYLSTAHLGHPLVVPGMVCCIGSPHLRHVPEQNGTGPVLQQEVAFALVILNHENVLHLVRGLKAHGCQLVGHTGLNSYHYG